jgi:predicted transposase/invertase (TIGR01784 family)
VKICYGCFSSSPAKRCYKAYFTVLPKTELRGNTDQTVLHLQFRRPVAGVLAEACEIAAFPQDKKLEYEKEMLSERDIQAICSYAHDEGERKGREEGLMEGERKGRKEERLSIAKSLLMTGVPAETVAKATGLSLETVQDLAAKI